jgi:hypothetical protein
MPLLPTNFLNIGGTALQSGGLLKVYAFGLFIWVLTIKLHALFRCRKATGEIRVFLHTEHGHIPVWQRRFIF